MKRSIAVIVLSLLLPCCKTNKEGPGAVGFDLPSIPYAVDGQVADPVLKFSLPPVPYAED